MAKNTQPIVGPHLIRYGIAADQKYLVGDFLNTYDHLVINASMVAHMPAALALFITQRTKNKPYFIDPQTHAFQHDLEYLQSDSEKSEGKIKKSIRALIDAYGEPIKQIIDNEESILPEDFDDRKIRSDFCKRVIEFQLKTIAEKVKHSENVKYWEFLKEKGITNDSSFEPNLVVAPYFYMAGTTFSEWLRVNIDCAKDSIDIAKDKKKSIATQIVISKDILSESDQINALTKAYSAIRPDAFLIWIDSFSEQEASAELLQSLIYLAKGLNAAAPVINLYGGFFSILLMHQGILTGVTHGLEYGEDRPVVPVGGGVPTAKFYLPALHSRLLFRDAFRAVRQMGGLENVSNFYAKVCDCEQCRNVICTDPNEDFEKFGITKPGRDGKPYPTPETRDNSVKHYMWRKQKEYKQDMPIRTILPQLEEAGKQLKRVLGLENTEHCSKWAQVLKDQM